ncbi:hypothetical protein [Chryseobacterium caseinilyticum]|uniref:Uncharacterized protein n=1 Tax=Chryseobacterium caseinilyticum TaxID=2771428 RepID=A0ABR8ZES1_9FLAO|nr:hypothetical protein [Chryseobacterium caseinilyticum]MBD8083796.1 hypothetical protein [Chryseobacterium caseinilyticum]
MKTFISTLTALQFIVGFIGFIIIIIAFLKKNMYEYHPSIKETEMFKINTKHFLGGTFILVCLVISGLKTQLIKKDFQDSLNENKINFVEINGIYFTQYDIRDLFKNFEHDAGRYRCEKFSGLINLENDKNIPIEVIKHCYDKDKYIIISKAFETETTIGEIITDKFNQLVIDSASAQQ